MSGHTPGPWGVHRTLKGFNRAIVPADHLDRKLGASSDPEQDRTLYAQHIATVHKDWHDRSNLDADARLIAAAPELLEAAEEVLRVSGRGGAAHEDLQRVVDKARGRT